MENYISRQRYVRRTAGIRRRRRTPNPGSGHNGIRSLIARQVLICAILLLIAGIVKMINIPVSNLITEKVKYVLEYNMKLKNVLIYFDNLALDIKNSIAPSDSNTAAEVNAEDVGLISGLEEQGRDEPSDAPEDDNLAVSEPVNAPEDDNPAVNEPANVSVEPEKYAEAEPEYQKTAVLSATTDEGENELFNMLIPVDGMIDSFFGKITDTVTGNVIRHSGIDIITTKGSNVRASLDGEIIEAGAAPAYGLYIKMMHTDNLYTVYGNCSRLIALEGDKVKRGDIIASIGDADIPVGAHLHFEVWKDGAVQDPLEFINVSGEIENLEY